MRGRGSTTNQESIFASDDQGRWMRDFQARSAAEVILADARVKALREVLYGLDRGYGTKHDRALPDLELALMRELIRAREDQGHYAGDELGGVARAHAWRFAKDLFDKQSEENRRLWEFGGGYLGPENIFADRPERESDKPEGEGELELELEETDGEEDEDEDDPLAQAGTDGLKLLEVSIGACIDRVRRWERLAQATRFLSSPRVPLQGNARLQADSLFVEVMTEFRLAVGQLCMIVALAKSSGISIEAHPRAEEARRIMQSRVGGHMGVSHLLSPDDHWSSGTPEQEEAFRKQLLDSIDLL